MESQIGLKNENEKKKKKNENENFIQMIPEPLLLAIILYTLINILLLLGIICGVTYWFSF